MTVSFALSDFEKFGKWLEGQKKNAVRKAAVSAAYQTLGVIVNELIPGERPPPVFDGAYRAAWHVEVGKNEVSVVNTLPYASVVEGGARKENIKPGRAMIEALTDWVRRKGLTGKTTRSAKNLQAAESIAWAIVRAMQGFGQRSGGRDAGIFNRNGQKGLRIAERAQERMLELFKQELADLLRNMR